MDKVMPKRRSSSAQTERAGLIAVESACNDLNLIWRDLFQQDVGVDGTIEICLGDFPTGKIIGAQVKSGMSYIKSEQQGQFKFYPRDVDLEYWSQLSIPLFLLVFHPRDCIVYWYDMGRHIHLEKSGDLKANYTVFEKSNQLNETFASYLMARFDLTVYDPKAHDELIEEMNDISLTLGEGKASAKVTALDLFVEGLWGLCSKVQFHASLLLTILRRQAAQENKNMPVAYTFSRSDIYPFLTRYFAMLTKHHLAVVDADDINNSLYKKMELPNFIAPLTTNGRAFVEHLRGAGRPHIHDNQFYSLGLTPIQQIEVYSEFDNRCERPKFGPYTDVFAIRFNQFIFEPGPMSAPPCQQFARHHVTKPGHR